MGSDPTGPATVAGPDLRQMRYIVKVAELGGFTAAAADLHVAQQAVSQQVRATERMLGVTLFRRAPRAVTPTPAGEVFLREAKRVLIAAERLSERTWAAARGEVGPLRIAYTMTSAYDTFPELHAALGEALPGLAVRARRCSPATCRPCCSTASSSSRSRPGARYPTVSHRNLSARSHYSLP